MFAKSTAVRALAACSALCVTPMFLIGCGDNADESTSQADSLKLSGWEIPLENDKSSSSQKAIEELSQELRRIAKEYDGEASFALALPGDGNERHVLTVGQVSDEAAWSTSKVPVAIAALRNSTWIESTIVPMIEESDNLSAEMAWVSFGNENNAVESVNEVLKEGGDSHTHFEPWVAPGDVEWALEDQAVFGANLPCVKGAESVLDKMSHIVDYQSYGLSTLDGARFKGGWGPDAEGGYLIRQFGVVPVDGGEIGVAIAARPGDTTDETGREMLTDISHALATHLPRGGSCQEA